MDLKPAMPAYPFEGDDPFEVSRNPPAEVPKSTPLEGPDQSDPFAVSRDPMRYYVPQLLERSLKAEKTWSAVEPELKGLGLDPEQFRQNYQLAEARAVQKGTGVSWPESFARRSVGFADVLDVKGQKEYAAAKKRFDEGKATGSDAYTIARYERLAEIEEKQHETYGGLAVAGLASVPKFILEGQVAGGIVGGVLGRAGRALGVGQTAATTLGGQVGRFLGRGALMTPLMPSMYLEQARTRNIEAGREPDHWKGFPTPLAMGYANVLVLGSLQSRLGAGIPTTAGRAAFKGGLGAYESANIEAYAGFVDEFLADEWKTGTRYGPMGDLFRGDHGEALKKATTTAFTFAVFAGLHDKGPKDIGRGRIGREEPDRFRFPDGGWPAPAPVGPSPGMAPAGGAPGPKPGPGPGPGRGDAWAKAKEVFASFNRAVEDMVAKGTPREQVAGAINRIQDLLVSMVQGGHAVTRDQLRDVVLRREPPGPIRDHALRLIDLLPDLSAAPRPPGEAPEEAAPGEPPPAGPTPAGRPPAGALAGPRRQLPPAEGDRIRANEDLDALFAEPPTAPKAPPAEGRENVDLDEAMGMAPAPARPPGATGPIAGGRVVPRGTLALPRGTLALPRGTLALPAARTVTLEAPRAMKHISGEPMQRIRFTTGTGASGEVRVIPRGEDLHVEWIGLEGAKPGEQAGELGRDLTKEVLRQVVLQHPDAKYITGTRVGGARARAGKADQRVRLPIPGRGGERGGRAETGIPTGIPPAAGETSAEGKSPEWVATFNRFEPLVGPVEAAKIADADHPQGPAAGPPQPAALPGGPRALPPGPAMKALPAAQATSWRSPLGWSGETGLRRKPATETPGEKAAREEAEDIEFFGKRLEDVADEEVADYRRRAKARGVPLNAKEVHVLEQRALGRSLGDIGTDRQLRGVGGKPLPKQRVMDIERRALKKVGMNATTQEMLAADIAKREEIHRRRGETVTLSGQDPEEIADDSIGLERRKTWIRLSAEEELLEAVTESEYRRLGYGRSRQELEREFGAKSADRIEEEVSRIKEASGAGKKGRQAKGPAGATGGGNAPKGLAAGAPGVAPKALPAAKPAEGDQAGEGLKGFVGAVNKKLNRGQLTALAAELNIPKKVAASNKEILTTAIAKAEGGIDRLSALSGVPAPGAAPPPAPAPAAEKPAKQPAEKPAAQLALPIGEPAKRVTGPEDVAGMRSLVLSLPGEPRLGRFGNGVLITRIRDALAEEGITDRAAQDEAILNLWRSDPENIELGQVADPANYDRPGDLLRVRPDRPQEAFGWVSVNKPAAEEAWKPGVSQEEWAAKQRAEAARRQEAAKGRPATEDDLTIEEINVAVRASGENPSKMLGRGHALATAKRTPAGRKALADAIAKKGMIKGEKPTVRAASEEEIRAAIKQWLDAVENGTPGQQATARARLRKVGAVQVNRVGDVVGFDSDRHEAAEGGGTRSRGTVERPGWELEDGTVLVKARVRRHAEQYEAEAHERARREQEEAEAEAAEREAEAARKKAAGPAGEKGPTEKGPAGGGREKLKGAFKVIHFNSGFDLRDAAAVRAAWAKMDVYQRGSFARVIGDAYLDATPAEREAIRKAVLEAIPDAIEVGDPGSPVEFDANLHDTADNIRPGERAEVVEPGLAMHGYMADGTGFFNIAKARVRRVVKGPSGGGKKPPPPEPPPPGEAAEEPGRPGEAAEEPGRPGEVDDFPFGGGTGPAFAGAPIKLSFLDKYLKGGTGIGKAVSNWLKKWFTTKGRFPQEVFEERLKRDGRVAAEVEAVREAARDLRAALLYRRTITEAEAVDMGLDRADIEAARRGTLYEEKLVRPEHLTDAQLRQLNAALQGDRVALAAIPAPAREVIGRMRQHIDLLSVSLMQAGVLEGKLAAVVGANLGVYLNRSYRVFEDPKWMEKVYRDHPGVVQAFKAWLRAERLSQGIPTTEADLEGVTRDLLHNGTAHENPIAFLAGSRLGAKDLGILTRRKDVPAPLRALWGEKFDPIANYATTVGRMTQLLANHNFLTAVRHRGLGKFLSETPTPELWAKIADDGSKTMKPLDGLYASQELQEAFKEAYAKSTLPGWAKFGLGMIGLTKSVATVGSMVTHIRNYLSGYVKAVANGHWRVGKKLPAIRALLDDSPAGREYYRELLEERIVGEGVNEGDFKGIIRDVYNEREVGATEAMGVMSDRRLWSTLRKGAAAMERLYRAEDAVWKVYAYENEKANYREAYPEWSEAQVRKKAAEIVRNTMWTYSMLPEAIKGLRRVPFVGPFVSFPAEVVRATYHTARQAVAEYNDPRTRAIGARRLAGLAIAGALPFALAAATRALAGVTADEEEDMRRFLPDWSKNHPLLHLGRDPETGSPRVLDLGQVDPHAYLQEAVIGLFRTGNPAVVADALAKPFITEELLAERVMDVARNQKKGGGHVWTPGPSPVQRSAAEWKRVGLAAGEHVGATFVPGTVKTGRRVMMAATGTPEASGRKYDLHDELMAAVGGQRVTTIDIDRSLTFKSKRFQAEKANAARQLLAGSAGMVSDEELVESYRRAEVARRQAYDELRADAVAAMKLKMDRATVAKTIHAAGVSQADSLDIVAGRYRPLIPDLPRGIPRAEAYRRLKVLQAAGAGR